MTPATSITFNDDGSERPFCAAVPRRTFYVYKQTNGVWAVRWGEQIISTHSTRDGAVVSCNQLNEAEGWPQGVVR